MSGEIADVYIGLAEGLDNKKTPLFGASQELLEKLHQPDNICHRFLAVRLWNEHHKTKAVYGKRLKSGEGKAYIDGFIDRIEGLTLPCRYSIENEIMGWQCGHPKYPMHLL